MLPRGIIRVSRTPRAVLFRCFPPVRDLSAQPA
jgi:hypothetical protein